MHAGAGHWKRVTGSVSTNDEGEASDVPIDRAAQSHDSIAGVGLSLKGLNADDFLPNPEYVTEAQGPRRVGLKLEVNTVQRRFVADGKPTSRPGEARVSGREVTVTGEHRAGVTSDDSFRSVRQRPAAGFSPICAQGSEEDAATGRGETNARRCRWLLRRERS
jgi:hypothetical protein